MSNEEIKEIKEIEENKEQTCKCGFCKTLKKILTIALGTFLGFYCAMSLFFAFHKPPMMHKGHCFHKHSHVYGQGFEKRDHKMKGEKPYKYNEASSKTIEEDDD